jgi:glycyl-tRNA synthetase
VVKLYQNVGRLKKVGIIKIAHEGIPFFGANMSSPFNFQSMILTLQQFWAAQGCLIWEPYYTQVGAGTMNPATFLRVLGPEPWNVVYVEPSIRPDDGRYGENPNRMQQFYQMQVILKPDPGNPQELYLRSLEALGIDPKQHDIRFVEDNWEQPAIGAWGLGWEVWLDGQEITQFTYFQQSGGVTLEPVSVEITYGLERIAMTLQRVRHFREISWSDTIKYGDINFQGELEHSRYYFEVANVERLRSMYDLFEKEAEAALDHKLVLPAHDYILKCSHTFNVLDVRGAVGVTERQAFFRRMRELSRRVAEEYLEQRKQLEYPWLEEKEEQGEGKKAPGQEVLELTAQGKKETSSASLFASLTSPFLLEIGTEELPAGDLNTALQQLVERIPAFLDNLHLEHGDIRILGTPRRLVVSVSNLAARQADSETVVKGPPVARAYDAQGNPTQAAVGFARSRGLKVEELKVREIGGGQYITALVSEKGKPADEVLRESLPGLIADLRFGKTMRWNSSNVAFSRPIRWLVGLFGEEELLFEYAGVVSGRTTRGLRFHEPEQTILNNVEEYFAYMRDQGIILDPVERRNEIQKQVRELMRQSGGEELLNEALLNEVTNLVEAPEALRGAFEEAHLNLPADVLISVMEHHQRYFPVQGPEGLLPYFIAVRNGDGQYLETVADGNEQVIRARFSDALFFIREDLAKKLEDFLPRLGTLIFQFKLGSMLDKSQRIEKIVDGLACGMKLSNEEITAASRAAHLCKADLVTHMVVEMTSLQGVMGRHYAVNSGESRETAQAIYEHYLPRFAGDILPKGKPGLLVGVADRLDSLIGLFSAGLAPTGTKDPFALRRAALGLIQNLIGWQVDFELKTGLELASLNLPLTTQPEVLVECLEFIIGRMRNYLIEQGYRYDVVDAVLTVQKNNPFGCAQAVKDLSEWIKRPDWRQILPAFARCVRITRSIKEEYTVDERVFTDSAEKELYKALLKTENTPRKAGSVQDFLQAFLEMIPAINRYFDEVLVMAEDVILQQNRLATLQRISNLAKDIADFSNLEGF